MSTPESSSNASEYSASGSTLSSSQPLPMLLHNGQSAPQSDIPLLSLGMFTHWLKTEVRGGGRIVAFFALPDKNGQRAEKTAHTPDATPKIPCPLTLVAVVAVDATSTLHVAGVVVLGAYPSLTNRLPEMHLFERDIYERYNATHGIEPQGHPWLKPVRFPHTDGAEVGITDFYSIAGNEVHEVSVGPIHAGVIECGHFRFQCLGEVVMHLEVSLGYHHRGVQAMLTGGPDSRTLGLMETLCGDASIAHAWAYCTLVESLANLSVSPHEQNIRALALELERLANHTGDLGALAGDTGFLPTMSYCGRLRGDWLNMTALVCGNRFGKGLLCPGGTRFDVDADMAHTLKQRIVEAVRDVHGAIQLMWYSPSVMARITAVGIVPREQAIALGLVGPPARACGLARDARTHHPLPHLPPPPLIQYASLAEGQSAGDVLTRAIMKQKEIESSVAFCLHLLDTIIEKANSTQKSPNAASVSTESPTALTGEALVGDVTRTHAISPDNLTLAQERITIALVEGWRGELCHVALTDTHGHFATYEIIDPSFHNWMGLALALREQQISDFPLCNKSFNLSYCGHDL